MAAQTYWVMLRKKRIKVEIPGVLSVTYKSTQDGTTGTFLGAADEGFFDASNYRDVWQTAELGNPHLQLQPDGTPQTDVLFEDSDDEMHVDPRFEKKMETVVIFWSDAGGTGDILFWAPRADIYFGIGDFTSF